MGKEINQIDIKTNKVIKTFKTVNDVFRELGKTMEEIFVLFVKIKETPHLGINGNL